MHYYQCPYCPPDRESYLYKSHVDDVEYEVSNDDDDDHQDDHDHDDGDADDHGD